MFSLRFDPGEIEALAARYDYQSANLTDDDIAATVWHNAQTSGHLTKSDLLTLCRWKTPRTQPSVEKNPESFVKEVTAVALTTLNEQLRIEVLTLLRGVSWPTASVILHFAHPNPYPILDVRALWSLGIDDPNPGLYDFDFWWAYTQTCRELAAQSGVTMRTLDRALWQHSKEAQQSQ